MLPEIRSRRPVGARKPEERERAHDSLETFFSPRGIAVIGASGDPKKLGFVLTRNLLRSGYGGAVHLVNRHGKRALARTLYNRVTDVPDPVDLAIIVVPAPGVPEELVRCADRGIRAVIIISGGFGETGPTGLKLEETCKTIARERGLRILGPNCIGLIDNYLPLDTTFLTPPGAPVGEVGLISQSGSLCAAAVDWSRAIGFGWSRIVSLGNQIDVDETDLLRPIGSDEKTRVVSLYLEGVRDGRRFVHEAAKISRIKPIVALKVGHSESGQEAVSSHTGALAGQDRIYDAAFRRAGIFRAHTTEEMFHVTRSLAWAPIPHGSQVSVLTNAGGPGVVAVDELEQQGLSVAQLSRSTVAGLKKILPSAASFGNPVDMLASASATDFSDSLRLLLADSHVDAVLVLLPPPPAYPAEHVVEAVLPVIAESAKPVVFVLMGGARMEVSERLLRESHVPAYRFPEPAVAGLAALAHRGRFLSAPTQHDLPSLPFDVEEVRRLTSGGAGDLLPDRAAALAVAAGIDTAATCRVSSGRGAMRTARRLGYPVVLKAAAPGLVHKTDVGGVALGIPGRTALASAFRRMREHVEEVESFGGRQVYFLQHMAPDGLDVVVGAIRDPQFGPVVMFGTGGIEAELRGDVVFELSPLSIADALGMIDATEAGTFIQGFRGKSALDRNAVAEAICRVGRLMEMAPDMVEFEINPLRVHERGVLALDARGRLVGQAQPETA